MELYHILNRGVDKRKLFMDRQDHLRFIHDLFEFNDNNLIKNVYYRFRKQKNNLAEGKQRRKLLVRIHAFCLMPNHYHLLLEESVENGIPRFMKKVDMGYAKYFNQKYERSGALFEGRYKWVPIQTEAHFIHIPYYIHCNPLDLINPEWRKGKLRNYSEAIKFLESYRWSSHLDYLNKKNFPSVTDREFLLNFFNNNEGYKTRMYSWLKKMDIRAVSDLTLEN